MEAKDTKAYNYSSTYMYEATSLLEPMESTFVMNDYCMIIIGRMAKEIVLNGRYHLQLYTRDMRSDFGTNNTESKNMQNL